MKKSKEKHQKQIAKGCRLYPYLELSFLSPVKNKSLRVTNNDLNSQKKNHIKNVYVGLK